MKRQKVAIVYTAEEAQKTIQSLANRPDRTIKQMHRMKSERFNDDALLILYSEDVEEPEVRLCPVIGEREKNKIMENKHGVETITLEVAQKAQENSKIYYKKIDKEHYYDIMELLCKKNIMIVAVEVC